MVAAALPSVEQVQQERWMMMKAGLSYADWKSMAHFQRVDWLARFTVDAHALRGKLENAKGFGPLLSVVLQKLMGF